MLWCRIKLGEWYAATILTYQIGPFDTNLCRNKTQSVLLHLSVDTAKLNIQEIFLNQYHVGEKKYSDKIVLSD